jgi:hypothetical protein
VAVSMAKEAILPVVGLASFITATALLVVSIRPTASSSLNHHWHVFGAYAACAALLMLAASMLVGRRHRIAVALTSTLAIAVATLAHPVCVLIPEADRPSFESIIPLQERAARGEPFCKLGGQWYQCKSFVSRTFFF